MHCEFCGSFSIGQSQVALHRCSRCAKSNLILKGTGVPVFRLLLSVSLAALAYKPSLCCFVTLPRKACILLFASYLSTCFDINSSLYFQDSTPAKGEPCSDKVCDNGETIFLLCLLQVAINWCICQDTIPIPGAKNLQQAEGNLGALGWRLTSGEQAALAEVADTVPRGMVQNIFQTK